MLPAISGLGANIVMRWISLPLWMLAFCQIAVAGSVQYGATPEESQWTASGTIYECRLQQKIPHFGEADFVRKAGRKLALTVQAFRFPDRKGTAEVRTIAPDWKQNHGSKVLGKVNYHTNREILSLAPTLSNRLLDELAKGMYPSFHFPDWVDGKDKVTLFLSAVNFKKGYDDFLGCSEKLLDDSLDDLKETNLNYNSKESALTEADKERLNKIMRYVMKDPKVKLVLIEGHTDSVGRIKPNERLSMERAEKVADYLLSQGLAKEKIKISALGKSQPLVSNSTDEGKATNRRVHLEIILK